MAHGLLSPAVMKWSSLPLLAPLAFATRLLPALVALATGALLTVSTPALAGPVDDAGAALRDAESRLAAVAKDRAFLQSELDRLAARIERRKAEGRKLLGDAELTTQLEDSQRLAERVAARSRDEDGATVARRAAAEALLTAFDREIATARGAAVGQRGTDKAALLRLQELKVRREVARRELLQKLGGPAAAPASFAAAPSDDPDELRERADLLRDGHDRVARKITELDRRITEVREEAEVEREMRDFLGESELFDESDRVVRVTRPAGSPQNLGIRAPGPVRGRTAGEAPAAPAAGAPSGNSAGGGTDDGDTEAAPPEDPGALAGSGPPAPNYTGDEADRDLSGLPAPIAYPGRPAELAPSAGATAPQSASVLPPAPGLLSGVRAPSPDELTRSSLPALTGDETLPELLARKAALQRMAGELRARAETLEQRARDLGARR